MPPITTWSSIQFLQSNTANIMATTDGTSRRIELDRLLYTWYQHPDLEVADKFFQDFGLHPVERKDNIIYYRGFGENPFVYVAEQSPDGSKHFQGGGFLVRSHKDLETAAAYPGASGIQESTAPGKGLFVDLKDPHGINVRLLHGVNLRTELEVQEEQPKPVILNTWNEKPRKGEFQRFASGPSKVHKLGHYGVVVDQSKFDDTVSWYLKTFSLAVTDSLFLKESGKDMMTFMHIDKGEEFTDHHVSYALFIPPRYPPHTIRHCPQSLQDKCASCYAGLF